METQAIILAAGQGTRMNHPELPKVLIEAAGKPLLQHVVDRLSEVGVTDPTIVVKYREEKVRGLFPGHRFVTQGDDTGTGAATLAAKPELGSFEGGIYLIYGDCPAVSRATLEELKRLLESDPSVAVVVTTGQVKSSEERYGRIVRKADGAVERIVEFKDATDEERQIREYNAGPYIVRSPWLWQALDRMEPSLVTGEYYVTDIVEFANQDGMKVLAYPVADQGEAQGVNTPEDLAAVEAILRGREDQER